MATEAEIPSEQMHITPLQLPPFWNNRPALWFARVESQFRLNGITSDSDKYDRVVGEVDMEVLEQVADIVENPPLNEKYASIKKRLLIAYGSASEEEKVAELLHGLQLGSQLPSQLLHSMSCLAKNMKLETVLKFLWLERLPIEVQCGLAASGTSSLDALAKAADRIAIAAAKNNNELNQASSTSKSDKTEEAIEKKPEGLKNTEDRDMIDGKQETFTADASLYEDPKNCISPPSYTAAMQGKYAIDLGELTDENQYDYLKSVISELVERMKESGDPSQTNIEFSCTYVSPEDTVEDNDNQNQASTSATDENSVSAKRDCHVLHSQCQPLCSCKDEFVSHPYIKNLFDGVEYENYFERHSTIELRLGMKGFTLDDIKKRYPIPSFLPPTFETFMIDLLRQVDENFFRKNELNYNGFRRPTLFTDLY